MASRALADWLLRQRLEITDRVRNAAWLRALVALSLLARSLFRGGASSRRLRLLADGYRFAEGTSVSVLFEQRLEPQLTPDNSALWRASLARSPVIATRLADPVLTKTILLKDSGDNGEKGVLYVAFEYNWLRLLSHYDVPALLREYLLVVSPTQSPPNWADLWALAHIGPDPVFVQSSHPADPQMFRRFEAGLVPLPIMACDWVNPSDYEPRSRSNRSIDLLMVAGWNHYKRHHALFGALRKMRPGLRTVLVGQKDLWSASEIRRQADAYGVSDRIELMDSAAHETVATLLCDSKTSVLLSRREGSAVVAVESLFSDTPIAMLEGAHIGSRAYINDRTGVLLTADGLEAQLERFVAESQRYHPRAWALENLGCLRAREKLNEILRQYALSKNLPWTTDIAAMCKRPNPMYVDAASAERLRPAYARLAERHGVVIANQVVNVG